MPLRRPALLSLLALLPAAAFAGRPQGQSAPVPDAKIIRAHVEAVAGLYQGKGVEVNVSTTGSAATVQVKEQKSKEQFVTYSGVGLARHGVFAAATSRAHDAGITIYHLEPGGHLVGVGAEANGWNNVSIFAENLVGNSTLGGTYKIATATDIQGHAYGGTVTITQTAPDTYSLAWHLGSTEYWGAGLVLNDNLWTAWSKDKEARLTLYSPASSGDSTTFKRLLLSDNGEPAMELPPVSLVKAAPKEAPEPTQEPDKKSDKTPAVKKPKPDKKK
jgi:hypothetical protein